MKKILVFYFASVLLITACQGSVPSTPTHTTVPTPTIQYQVVGISGNTTLVVVDPKSGTDRSGFMSISNYLCNDKVGCYILFWDDINKAATSLPPTDTQDQAIIATYTLNKSTGFEELLVCGLGDC